MSDLDVTLLKSIYNKGYKACVNGEKKSAPYGKQTEKAVEWRRGYDAARKKKVRSIDDGKFDMGKVVESVKARPSPTVNEKVWANGEVKVGAKPAKPVRVISSEVEDWSGNEVDGSSRKGRSL